MSPDYEIAASLHAAADGVLSVGRTQKTNVCSLASSQLGAVVSAGPDPVGSVDDPRVRGVAGADRRTVSYLQMRTLAELRGQPGWVAALTPQSVDVMIVAASTTPSPAHAGERNERVGVAGPTRVRRRLA